jgi:hypothetical protein
MSVSGQCNAGKLVKLSRCLIKHHTTKMYGKVEVENPQFLTSAMEASDRHQALAALPQYALYGRLYGPQRWCGCRGEEQNLLTLPRIEP